MDLCNYLLNCSRVHATLRLLLDHLLYPSNSLFQVEERLAILSCNEEGTATQWVTWWHGGIPVYPLDLFQYLMTSTKATKVGCRRCWRWVATSPVEAGIKKIRYCMGFLNDLIERLMQRLPQKQIPHVLQQGFAKQNSQLLFVYLGQLRWFKGPRGPFQGGLLSILKLMKRSMVDQIHQGMWQ